MHKCLELMNIKIGHAISEIHGASGMKMLKAITGGERDAEKLLALCDKKIINNKGDAVKKSLEANYNDTWLFMLSKNIELWEEHEKRIAQIDERISTLLNELTKEKELVDYKPNSQKKIRHHKPKIDGLQDMLVKLYGVDVSRISGINNYTLLRLLGETGIDMSRFETRKHFVSWCSLSSGRNQSGKLNKFVKRAPCNKAGQIFKEVAQSLENSKFIAIGQFIRELKIKRGASVAYKAGARKVAEAFYDSITKGNEYVEYGIKKYEEQKKQKEITLLKKLAKKHDMQLTEIQKCA